MHRDLKPGNIMLTKAGAKLLDFGLAKHGAGRAGAAGRAGTDLTAKATQGAPLTSEGTILGTFNYMAPEQLEGKDVDARADLFAFGAVVYEMATGRKAFDGATQASVIAAIIERDPPPMSTLQPLTPPALERVVRRCLAKDQDDRWQTARDLLEEVKWLRDNSGTTVPPRAAPTRPRRVGLAIAAAAAVLVVAFAIQRRTASPSDHGGLESVQVVQLTTSGNASRPAISPDGKFVAYVQQDGNDYSLWIRQTTSASNVEIVKTEPGIELYGATVSPDGNFVDFVRRPRGQISQIWRVPFLGGHPQLLIDNAWTPIDWSPDGRRLAFIREDRARGTSSLIVADADATGVGMSTASFLAGITCLPSSNCPWSNCPLCWTTTRCRRRCRSPSRPCCPAKSGRGRTGSARSETSTRPTERG